MRNTQSSLMSEDIRAATDNEEGDGNNETQATNLTEKRNLGVLSLIKDIKKGFTSQNKPPNSSFSTLPGSFRQEKITMSKQFMKYSLRFLFIDLNNCPANLESVLRRRNHHLAVVVNGDCENVTNVLNVQTDKKYFYETFHWLIVDNSKNAMLFKLDKVKLNINSEVHLAICENSSCVIYDVYNPASEHGGKLVATVLGHYKTDIGYKAEMSQNKYWLRRNMTGVNFKSAVVLPRLDKPLKKYLEDEENRQINSMHRFQTVCVNYCRDFFNFSLEIQRTNSWGYIQSDGHFDGLVSLLERRIVDFGSSPLIFKLDRLPVIDYSFGNWILRSTFIYRRPDVVAEYYEIFLRPLSKWVWICVLIAMIVIVIALKIVLSNESSIGNNVEKLDSSWSFLWLYTFGAFCQQGATFYPKFFSSRILSIFVYLFCILIYQFYSAGIVSYLLMDPPRIINNLEDLTESQLRVGIEDILIDRNYFVQTTDPNAIALFERKIKGSSNDSGFYSPIEGLEMVREGGFAFHVETSTAYPIIEATFTNELICELQEVQMYRTQPMHTNLQKNSPFKEMLNYCMFKLSENGNMDRLRKHWDARKPTCIESAKKTVIHVSLKEFSCGLISLLYGICFALLFLLMEIVIYKRYALANMVKVKIGLRPSYPYIN
ncbi:glutamate receptor 2-like [Anoplophora glabripennis]|uniref:glutamate receptor 2-like n=1 Tax=Anoplophora glabripennis TaxID=217634 RepID=UPI000C758E3A|nr:glutamate receptor 2-like [Anoplophora glabripennis]